MSGLGRPSIYTPELGAEICKQIAAGKSLRTICAQDEFPSKSTVLKWIFQDKNKEFSDQYEQAREIQAQLLADEIIEIADTPQVGVTDKYGPEGNLIETKREDMLGHRRLQVDSRKWYLSKVLPKVYGDKLEQTVKGDPNAPLVMISPSEAKY